MSEPYETDSDMAWADDPSDDPSTVGFASEVDAWDDPAAQDAPAVAAEAIVSWDEPVADDAPGSAFVDEVASWEHDATSAPQGAPIELPAEPGAALPGPVELPAPTNWQNDPNFEHLSDADKIGALLGLAPGEFHPPANPELQVVHPGIPQADTSLPGAPQTNPIPGMGPASIFLPGLPSASDILDSANDGIRTMLQPSGISYDSTNPNGPYVDSGGNASSSLSNARKDDYNDSYHLD